jgi:predicted TIM-barrel fold metal-dependent hydrolase
MERIAAGHAVRLTDPVVLAFGLWAAVETGLPIQVHAGYGDPDLDLHRSDPLLLTDFIRATEGACQILLLHCYPFHRHAGYLAQMFAHVAMDIGLAVNHTGARSEALIAETLEVAPFTKILYSSDAWGLPELHVLGSWLFRRGLARVLGRWVAAGDWSLHDAARVIALIGHENARRIYGP